MYDEKSYLGFTVPEVDKILESYAEKSYEKYVNEYKENTKELLKELHISFAEKAFNPIIDKLANKNSTKKVQRDFEQGWQGIEMISHFPLTKFNTEFIVNKINDYLVFFL